MPRNLPGLSMIGKDKARDLVDFTLEFSLFSGSLPDVFTYLQENLNFIFGEKKVKIISPKTLNELKKNIEFETWLSNLDTFSQLIPLSDFPPSLYPLLGVNPKHRYGLPLYHSMLAREIVGFFLLPECHNELLKQLQILAVMTGQKISFHYVAERSEKFLRFSTLGQICHEIFHEIKNKLITPSTFLQLFP